MNCYFANVAGSPPVADLYCEGPLRPADMDWVPPQVDLKVTLTNLSGGSSIHIGNRLGLAALDFPEEASSNVTFTWSASLPVTNVLVRSSVRCEVVEETEQKGTLACGTVYNQNVGWPLTLELYFTPLQAGSLDLSIEFSSDEPETDPSDNVASVQWTIARESSHIATLSGHTKWVSSTAFSPDGTTIASGSGDHTVKLGDVATKTNTATLDGNSRVNSVAFSPDGTTLAVGAGDNGTIQLWSAETKINVATFSGHFSSVQSLAFSPDGTILASGADDGTVQLWDVSEWKRAKRLARAEERSGLPDSPQLQQNAPNPFNSETVLSYFLHAPGPARLEVFALTGQRVAVLHRGPQKAGYHRLRWNGRDDAGRSVASGMYLYRLVTDEGVLTRKLMLLR